ncbi:MAG: hypothetical protein A4S17_12845 [Proteobacteria bacterium HN_bin10]|nr:MAG: hypothetical protein A4S17_12845 [Proteobacteria bacterium HN_bin10]
MSRLFALFGFVAMLTLVSAPFSTVHAGAQQNKMKECNAKAGDKKGDERKAFMSECLSAKPAKAEAAGGGSQQNKMKECNVKAGQLKGDERKKFMSDCLSGK